MPVSPSLPRKVLVVHVGPVQRHHPQPGHPRINELIRARIDNIPLSYECELYRYENLNVDALQKYNTLLGLLVANPIGTAIGGAILEMIGDVVISLAE